MNLYQVSNFRLYQDINFPLAKRKKHPVQHVVHLYVLPFFTMYVKEGPWKLFGSISISEIRSLHYANLLWIHKAPLKSMQIYLQLFLQVSKMFFKKLIYFFVKMHFTYLVLKSLKIKEKRLFGWILWITRFLLGKDFYFYDLFVGKLSTFYIYLICVLNCTNNKSLFIKISIIFPMHWSELYFTMILRSKQKYYVIISF